MDVDGLWRATPLLSRLRTLRTTCEEEAHYMYGVRLAEAWRHAVRQIRQLVAGSVLWGEEHDPVSRG
jgi:hypothetical protein